MINVDDIILLVVPEDCPQITDTNPLVTCPLSCHVYNTGVGSKVLRQALQSGSHSFLIRPGQPLQIAKCAPVYDDPAH